MSDIELSLEDRIAQLEAEAARALAEAEAKKAEVEKLKADARQGVKDQIKALMKQHGIDPLDFFKMSELDVVRKGVANRGWTAADIFPDQTATEKKTRAKRGEGKPRSKGEAKYRNSIDPSQTWSGKGRKPEWVNTYLANGGELENLRIEH